MRTVSRLASLLPFLFLALLLPVLSAGSQLYTNNFHGADPPTNWTLSNTTLPLEVSGTTFNAQASPGYGYLGITVTTNANEKMIDWTYNPLAAQSWGDYTEQFVFAASDGNTNSALIMGVRAYNPLYNSLYMPDLRYTAANGSAWALQPENMTPSSPVYLTLTAGDVVTMDVTGSTVNAYVNGSLKYTGWISNSGSYASCYQGPIVFGIARTKFGASWFRISDLAVSGSQLTPTPTSTPDFTATPTFTFTATPTVTRSTTCTPTYTRTITATVTKTKTPTPTVTRTVTPNPTSTPVVWETIQSSLVIGPEAYRLVPYSDGNYTSYTLTLRAGTVKPRMLYDADVKSGNTYTASTADYSLMPAAGWSGTKRHAKGIYLRADSAADTVDAVFTKGSKKYPWTK